MISLETVIQIHVILLEKYGGSTGIRDKELLESAINRPFQSFDNKDLYPNSIDKSAAILESIVNNHPFIDGNKRVGYTLMRLMLLEAGFDIIASQDEKYDLVISVASGKTNFQKIKNWISERVTKYEP